ncbi:MAG: accessory gene regulator B family protein [Syntrophomonadaceae bacterium]
MHYLAQKLARRVTANSKQAVDEDVVRYGAEVILGAALQISLFLLAAYLCGLFLEIIGILAASAILRRYSGGVHCSTYYGCTFSGLVTYLLLAYLLRYFNYEYFVVYFTTTAIICYSLVYGFAPVDNPSKRINDPVKSKQLKYKSCIVLTSILLLSFFLYSSGYYLYALSLLLGLLWQSLTLTPGGELYIAAWDRFLRGIEKLIERRKHDVPSA